MDQKEFLFVTCVNNENLYNDCVKHIKSLKIPTNFSIELFPIYQAKSMTAGYNQALQEKAKYKIYLHQDTWIVNNNFLFDLLKLFESNPTLGLLGVFGCKYLASNGVFVHGKEYVGKMFSLDTGEIRLVTFGEEITTPFESVQAIDGILMATQYDIPWREDLFHGFHFYDTSQSVEFRKQGYLVGIAKQETPWCKHIGSNVVAEIKSEEFQKNIPIFNEHYNVSEEYRF
jgi:hypothetical protein